MEQDIAVATTALPDPGRSQVEANVQVEVEEVVEDAIPLGMGRRRDQ